MSKYQNTWLVLDYLFNEMKAFDSKIYIYLITYLIYFNIYTYLTYK
jgi:hypothetical protein